MTHPAPEDEARAQRQMLLCQELADLGMQVARAAAAQAVATLTPQPTTSAQAPSPTSDAALIFTRVSRAVRQAMMLESRIAADLRTPPKTLPADSRRPALRRLFHAAAAQAGRPELKAEAYERLDIELADDPRATVPDILATICETLGIALPADIIAAGPAWPPIRSGAPSPAAKLHVPPPPAQRAAAAIDPALVSLWSTLREQTLPEQDRRT